MPAQLPTPPKIKLVHLDSYSRTRNIHSWSLAVSPCMCTAHLFHVNQAQVLVSGNRDDIACIVVSLISVRSLIHPFCSIDFMGKPPDEEEPEAQS